MTNRNRTYRTRGRAPKRKTEWNDAILDNISLAAASGSQTGVQLFGPDTSGEGKTLLRTVGNLVINLPSTVGTYTFSWGLAVVEEDARAAGALPDPVTDEFPWLTTGLFSDNQAFTGNEKASLVVPIDVKARRRWNERLSLVFIFESQGSAGVVAISGFLRMLLAK